jgi:DNA-binding FadR family transcriptional regulator
MRAKAYPYRSNAATMAEHAGVGARETGARDGETTVTDELAATSAARTLTLEPLPEERVARLRVPKAAELVAADLRRQVVRGQLLEGAALPPEADLMEHFGVSRPTLREAFRILESERLISVRRGARGGARVHMPDITVAAQFAGLLLQVRGATLADVYNARLLIEPPLAGMLAQRRPEREMLLLRGVLAAEEADLGRNPEAMAVHFARFHQLIVEGAGNITLAVVAGMLARIVEKHLVAEITAKRDKNEQVRDNRRAYRAHKKLLELVDVQDAEGAEVFWRKHMQVAGELLLKDYGATTVVDLLS